MKKAKIIICFIMAIMILFSFALLACFDDNEDKKPDKSSDPIVNPDKPNDPPGSDKTEYTLSGLSGNGYTFTAEGFNVSDGKIVAEEGSQINLKLNLDENVFDYDVKVKIDGTKANATGGKYAVTLNKDIAVSVEGIAIYKEILDNPFAVAKGDDSSAGYGMAKNSFKVTQPWTESGYSFANLNVKKYLAVAFYVKGNDGAWFTMSDQLGLFNDEGQLIATNPNEDHSAGDDLWHKYEFIREVSDDNTISYRLYIDGVKAQEYGEAPVDARIENNLTNLSVGFNGTYDVTAVFGVEDKNYVETDDGYEIYETAEGYSSPITLVVDEYAQDMDSPYSKCEDINVYDITVWQKQSLVSLRLEKYSGIKFYIRASGTNVWLSAEANGTNLNNGIPADSRWHEISIEKTSQGYVALFDGLKTQATLKLNLNEMSLFFNDGGRYYISELFVKEDENYFAGNYEVINTANPLDFDATEDTTITMPVVENYEVTKAYKISTTEWTQFNFVDTDTLAYSRIEFYVKGAGISGKWLGIEIVGGDAILMVDTDSSWKMFELIKYEGAHLVYVNGELKGKITNLAQFKMALTDNAEYYITDIYGVVVENYESATITYSNGAGYTVTVENAYLKDGVATFEKGQEVILSVTLEKDYSDSEVVVKANGVEVFGENEKYIIKLNDNVEITVEGVVKNLRIIDPLEGLSVNGYTAVQNCIFNEGDVDTEILADSLITNKATHITKGWSATPNINFAIENESKYIDLKFFILAVDSNLWFLLKDDAGANNLIAFCGDNPTTWYEIRFLAVESGWEVYYNGISKGTISSLATAKVFLAGEYYVSDVWGIENF